jgi:hypothetical protein
MSAREGSGRLRRALVVRHPSRPHTSLRQSHLLTEGGASAKSPRGVRGANRVDKANGPRLFTQVEASYYNPRQCPTCGYPTMGYDFNDAGTPQTGPGVQFTLGRGICFNRRCASHGGPDGSDAT